MEKVKSLLTTKNMIVLFIIVIVIGLFIISRIKETQKNKIKYAKDNPSIAVLPFVNITKDTSQEYFSDGLTDGIHNSLAHLNDLKVSARASSFQFKKGNVDIKEIGRKLGVLTVLEGSVQLEEGRIIIARYERV